MTPAPLLSIVVPLFNDGETIEATLESCLGQTLPDIEVVCVDDASTDQTVQVVERFQARDSRVRLIRHDTNRSALQARRTGILAAAASHVLFVDGDDELEKNAARTAIAHARRSRADVVGFGVTVVGQDGRTGGSYEQRLQPTHRALNGTDVLRGLFPVGEPAQGQLWRHLFTSRILRDAYAMLPEDLVLSRVNDLPLAFLVAALAERYVSTRHRLYRYHLGRGGSGHRVDSIDRAQFYAGAIDSVESIRPAVDALASRHPDRRLLLSAYESVRQSIIGYVCHQVVTRSDDRVVADALELVYARSSPSDVFRATARFYPDTLTDLARFAPHEPLDAEPVRNVVLATSSLTAGGVTEVLLAQARYLTENGHRVVIVARKPGSDRAALPAGVKFVELSGRGLSAQLEEWADLCRSDAIDVVIDHQVLHTPHWPAFALMARSEGAATIGWVHSFVARPVYEGTDRLTRLERYSGALALLVVLSPLDVSYFKLRSVRHVAYMPNPPSSLLRAPGEFPAPRSAPLGRVSLAWWGRLEESTKRISELLSVSQKLCDLGVDFHLTVIGPDSDGTTARRFNADARRLGIDDRVRAVGPLHGAPLLDAIDAADVFVSTSIIEGYPLTIAEAQSRGLPVAMYELPWFSLLRDNGGVVTAPQGDAGSLARQIAQLIAEPDRYVAVSKASLLASHRAREPDLGSLYAELLAGELPAEYSPEPTQADSALLLALMTFYAERGASRARSRGGFGAKARVRATLIGIPGVARVARRVKRWLRR
ncbi:glycosyltransferase [Microbacterium sp. NPDC056044]|uniref:glycosyltransferase n=1 Tax=Microbacterium sp. NPDC056044 TaxID=3345690 RepID=UPI0035D96C13